MKKLQFYMLVTLLFMVISLSKAKAQTDPYARLKAIAATEDSIKSQESKVIVDPSNPVWKANYKTPIPFVPIPMTDKNGRKILPTEKIQLSNGHTLPADVYFSKLNELKKNLNQKGFTLNNKSTVVSQLVTPRTALDGRINILPKAKSKLKTDAQMASFLDPNFRAGTTILQPLGNYKTRDERTKVEQSVITKTGANNIKISPLKPHIVLPVISRLLKTINETTTRDQHFGSAGTFLAGLKVSLTRFANIYGPDGQHAFGQLSEFKISGSGKIYASLLNHSFDVFNANGEVYVPADSAKKMSAKIVLNVVGINILNLTEAYDQHKLISGTKARAFDKSFAASIPILPFIDFSGKIGIKGMVGYDYSGELDRAFIKGEFKPVADIEGYAEVGISDPYDIGTIGVRGTLIFIQGSVDLTGWFGIYNANSSQIVLGYGYNVSYYIKFLSGKLEVFYKVCVPDWVPWVGGDCTDDSHTVFNWSGFTDSGTYVDYRNLISIYDGPILKTNTNTN